MVNSNQASEVISTAITALAYEDKQSLDLYNDLCLIRKFNKGSEVLLKFLKNPWIDKEEKIKDIMGLKNFFSYSKTVNFLAFVTKMNAIVYFDKIIELTLKQLEEELGIVHLKIYSAFQLSDAQIKQLENAIKKQSNLLPPNWTKLLTEFEINKEIIGGIKIALNSKVIDNSLLEKIKQAKTASKTFNETKE